MQFMKDLTQVVLVLIAAAVFLTVGFYLVTFILPLLLVVGVIAAMMAIVKADRES